MIELVDSVRTKYCDVVGAKFRRQDLDQKTVLRPDFDELEQPGRLGFYMPAVPPRLLDRLV
jgi:hypothetical protein